MPALKPSKRLPSADRRGQILQAGAQLFVARGFEAVTMGDISAQLGVSRPTIYSYFTSTEALLDALLSERLRLLLARLEPLLAPDPPDPHLIETLLRFLTEERETLALLHSGGGPTFQARRHHFLNELGARLRLPGGLRVSQDPALLLIITSLLDSLAFRAVCDARVSVDALAPALNAFVRGGVLGLSRPEDEG